MDTTLDVELWDLDYEEELDEEYPEYEDDDENAE